jgi:hypothetical protein
MAPPSFMSSRAVQGYSPQFLDTGTQASAPMAGAQSPDLTNRLLQIMGGNLAGTLSGGEKLSALGALLKSVSRGSQQGPQDVLRAVQSQKMQEVQGALQIQELRKQAALKAETDALKAEYVKEAAQTNPQLARAIALMTPGEFSKLIIEQNKAKEPTRLAFDQGVAKDPFTAAVINPVARALGLPTIYGDDDPNYDKLSSGSRYVDADGYMKVKS